MIQLVYTNIRSASEESYERLFAAASTQRQAKATRYRCQEDRLRCVAADALLRWVIAQTPGMPPHCTIEAGPNGKPYISGAEHFHYNLSHSGNWVVIAFGDSPVGVDVETIRTSADAEAIARRWFTEEEYAWVFSKDESRLERFFQIWTGKESYLKYLGTGLTKSTRSFRVAAGTVEDPPGVPCPGLCLHQFSLEDACLSLCCRDSVVLKRELPLSVLVDC